MSRVSVSSESAQLITINFPLLISQPLAPSIVGASNLSKKTGAGVCLSVFDCLSADPYACQLIEDIIFR